MMMDPNQIRRSIAVNIEKFEVSVDHSTFEKENREGSLVGVVSRGSFVDVMY